MHLQSLFIMMLIFVYSCSGDKAAYNQEAASTNERNQQSDLTLNDLLGTWVDNRLINQPSKVSRDSVFRPASGFWFSRDSQTGKPLLNIQYFEHNYPFLFDSLVFSRNKTQESDSCFSIKGKNKSFLLLFHRNNRTIQQLQLIDSNYFTGALSQGTKEYTKAALLPVTGIEQFAMGKYLTDSVITLHYAGKRYSVHMRFDGFFYRLRGFPKYTTIQFIDWEIKDRPRLKVALAGKGDFEFFTLVQKDSSNYLLQRDEPRKLDNNSSDISFLLF